MPNTKNPTRPSASLRRAKAIPRGFRKHASWWRSEVPKLIEQINAVLANADEPQGPRAVLIEPRFVSFPLQSDLTGEITRSKLGEVCYGLPLPPCVTLADISTALQSDALRHLAAAHLWLRGDRCDLASSSRWHAGSCGQHLHEASQRGCSGFFGCSRTDQREQRLTAGDFGVAAIISISNLAADAGAPNGVAGCYKSASLLLNLLRNGMEA